MYILLSILLAFVYDRYRHHLKVCICKHERKVKMDSYSHVPDIGYSLRRPQNEIKATLYYRRENIKKVFEVLAYDGMLYKEQVSD